MTSIDRLCLGLSIALFALAVVGCTESDDELFDQIGVTQLLIVDPALLASDVDDEPYLRYQVAEWELRRADLTLADSGFDLLYGNPCVISDTVLFSPVTEGPCGSGLVVESTENEDDTLQLRLRIEVSRMQIRRARPENIPDVGTNIDDDDFEDGLFNTPCTNGQIDLCDDNCPLVFNNGQEDSDGNGVGDACTWTDGFSAALDSDGDGVPDSVDNCIWTANPDQEDTMNDARLTSQEIPDLIGDACDEQVAEVRLDGAAEFVLEFDPVELAQPLGATSFLTVDFNNRRALTNCDWESVPPNCELDADEVRFCASTSGFSALAGCFE